MMRHIYRLFALFWLLNPLPMAHTISLALKDAPTKDVIAYLASETGQNVVLTDNLNSQTTLRLAQQSFPAILNSIAMINQLQIQQQHGIFYITPRPNHAEPPAPPTTQTTAATAPKLVSKTIKLHYAKAAEVIESLTKGNGNLLSENGYLHFDDRSNQILLKDSPRSVAHLTRLIKQLDSPTEQIAIEARIVTISSEHLQALGVRWGMFSPSEGHHRFAGNFEGNGLISDNLNVNFPVQNAPSVALQIASINSRLLDLELNALEQENSVEIIASPRLLTTNKKSASIKQGTEIPYAIYDRKAELSDIQFKEAVLGLEVTPHLSPQQQILLDLVVTQNAPSNHGSQSLTTIDKQELKTQVFARHGETIVLGGIFQHLIAKGEDKVPILGSLPVLKRLFSQQRDKITKRELVIFVTPYVMQPPASPTGNPQKQKKSRPK